MMHLKKQKLAQTLRYYKRAFVASYGSQKPDPDYIHDLRVYCRRMLAINYLLDGDASIKRHFKAVLEHSGPIRDGFVYEKNLAKLQGTEIRNQWLQDWQPKSSQSRSIIDSHRDLMKRKDIFSEFSDKKVTKRFQKFNDLIIEHLETFLSEPNDKYLHKMRVKIKKLRYIHDVIETSRDIGIHKAHKLCREAQDYLGDYHDFENAAKHYSQEKDFEKEILKKFKEKRNKCKSNALVTLKKLLQVLQR
jgi:CHAD domain-containing protein